MNRHPVHERVQVWIYSENEADGSIYVVLLRLTAARGGFWQPVTGGVEPDEVPGQGALREALEETGLIPREATVLRALDYDFQFEGRWGAAHETGFYFESAPGRPKVVIDPSEHVESQWVPLASVLSLLHHESNREAFRRLELKLAAK